jgi:hypothetical protein
VLDAYKESKKLPEINASRADDAGSMLMKKTGATVVAVFKVNPLFKSEVGLWYLEKGVAYTCRVSIPPDNYRFVG